MNKKGLGRGLGALFEDAQEAAGSPPSGFDAKSNSGIAQIETFRIEPGKNQPRSQFDGEALAELAESIKNFGILQPLILKDNGGGWYSIIAGERRYRAARLAKLETVPAIIKDYTEAETLQVALIENVQRKDLNPIEEASCYKRLSEDFFFSAEEIASKVGKSRHAVVSLLRLLELDGRAQELASMGRISVSHATVLLAVGSGDSQYALALRAAELDLSVRELETLIASSSGDENKRKKPPEKEAPNGETAAAFRRAEDELKALLGSKVRILSGRKRGKIEIEYYSDEELDRLLCLLKGRGQVVLNANSVRI